MKEILSRIEAYVAIGAKNTLDTNEAALYMGMTVEALRNRLASVPHYKGENGRNYFRKDELDAWRCAHRVSNASERELDYHTKLACDNIRKGIA